MFLEDYNCVLCTSLIEESVTHLFLVCPFAIDCWASLGRIILRAQLQFPFSMEIIVTMCWSIWAVRNDQIFRDPTLQRCMSIFKRSSVCLVTFSL